MTATSWTTTGFAIALATVTACATNGPPAAASKSSATPTSTPPPPPIAWPLPPGWKHETIPFPLDFAPNIHHRGVEEVHFTPGMFKGESEQKWSYAFVWFLDGPDRLDAAGLSRDLADYFEGLALSAKEDAFDASKFRAKATLTDEGAAEAGHRHVQGTADIYDTFISHARVMLNVDADLFTCGEHPVALFTLSPQPRSADVWRELAANRAAFRCP